MFWCDYCKVWMQDNPSAKATHERGMKHQENVARSKFLGAPGHPKALFQRSHTLVMAMSSFDSCVHFPELRQMRQRADTDKKEAVLAEATMSKIEAAAQKQYQKDLAAAQAVTSSHGDWVSLQFFW